MQHGHQRLPSPQHSAAVSQHLESHTHLSTPPQYSPSHFIPPSRHHSQLSSFQNTFPIAPSPHVINDPSSHASSRRSIPSLLQNQQYQHRFSTDPTRHPNRNLYPPYASQTNHPYLHQIRYPANDTSLHPNCGHMLYMHTPPPTQPPYYPYHPTPSIPVQANPDQLHQQQQQQPTSSLPPPHAEPVGYQKSHHLYQGYQADHAMRPRSSPRAHIFGSENVVDPMQSLPNNISTVGNLSKDPDCFKPLTSLPPLRSAPSRVASHSFYQPPQGMPNMNVMMPPSRSVLSTVPYHPSTYMSPSVPAANVQQQVAETGHFYSNPYHHNTQSGFPPEQDYQRAPVSNIQWQTHLAPAVHARSTKDDGDDGIGFPSYYVGPDGVTRYYSQQAAPRKKRLQWTPELHAKFVKAVEEFGVETAVPKLLLQAMNVPGLTRENVASHLQKYRESMRKKKLEIERSNSGMKTNSKETGESKKVSDGEAKDGEVSKGQLEAKGDGERRSFIRAERGDSTKRLRDIEIGASETVDSKKQKTISNIHESEALKETQLTKQEVESYARVRARVDEALQLQTSRSRQGRREPDVT